MESKKTIVPEKHILVDNKIVEEKDFIKGIINWTESNFIFQANNIYLPNDIKNFPTSVNKFTNPILRLEKFKVTIGTSALSYLLYYILCVGIKIGRDMEKNDIKNKRIDNNLFGKEINN